MKKYKPTAAEVDALFNVLPGLHDSIIVNNDSFDEEETDKNQKIVIYKEVKNLYKACLKINQARKNLPFA
jgi:hypothetical protein